FNLLVAAVLVYLSAAAQTPAATIPEFEFITTSGTQFTKKNLGKTTPIFFILFDVSCDHCQHAISFLHGHQAQLAKATIYLVTLDPKDKATGFLQVYGPNLLKAKNTTLLLDPKNHFITHFTPRKYPSMMLYSKGFKLLKYEDDEKTLPVFLELIRTN
ncbi:MAG: redoxin domain-containing protein, partial [Chitinophagaceae bacterium]